METQEKKPAKKNVKRSPNFPVITLEEAIKYIGLFFSENKRAGVSKLSTLKSLGFKGSHGQSLGVLSALKKYNLVKEENDNYSLTPEALTILLANDEKRKEEMIKECALRPGIYASLWEKFSKTGLPSDNSLSDMLIFEERFNENTVSSFIRGFKATMEFAKLKFYEDIPEEQNASQKDEKNVQHDEVSKENKGNEKSTLDKDKMLKPNIMDYAIPRKGDRVAVLRLETPVSNDDIDTIIKWLDVLRGTIVEG